MLEKMACMEAMLLFQGGLGLLDCIASWRGQERHVSHGEGKVPFFSTNRGDIHTNGENHGFWVCFFWDLRGLRRTGTGTGMGTGLEGDQLRRSGGRTGNMRESFGFLVEGKCFDAL